jgi:hypothetical protein
MLVYAYCPLVRVLAIASTRLYIASRNQKYRTVVVNEMDTVSGL